MLFLQDNGRNRFINRFLNKLYINLFSNLKTIPIINWSWELYFFLTVYPDPLYINLAAYYDGYICPIITMVYFTSDKPKYLYYY